MTPAVRTTILWIHALGGIAWAGAALVFVIAAGAAGVEEDAGLALIRRLAPAIVRLGLGAMVFIVVTGVGNIYLAGMARHFAFSDTFMVLLSAKIALLGAMYFLLIMAWRAHSDLKSSRGSEAHRVARRLTRCNLAIAGCGGVALLLGLWLLGS